MRKRLFQKSLQRDYLQTFGTPHGKRVLWDILSNCHVFHSSYIPGKPIENTLFREGERNVGLRIMAMNRIENTDDFQRLADDSGEGL